MSFENHRLLKPNKKGQRRILALDGGGIRGVLSLGILERLEADLRHVVGNDKAEFRLCDYFDFIGGTSTGAIIAAGLSKGLSVNQIVDFFVNAGPLMFEKDRLIKRLWNKFKSDPLKRELQKVLGKSTTLGSRSLRTLLMIVSRNATTDSPWPLTNNPCAKYNARDREDCNLDLPLWQLIRASTAAPTYFPPEVVRFGSRDFVFVDGGTTPYNNPAFQMYRTATAAPFKLCWETGEDKMLIISVGTGSAPQLGQRPYEANRSMVGIAMAIAPEMMSGMAYDQDINCRVVGRCVFGASLDREVGDLVHAQPLGEDLGRSFLYARYDPELTAAGLDGLGLEHMDAEAVGELDAVDQIDNLLKIGRTYGARHADIANHAGSAFL